jgi:hypothetical protein
MIVIFEIVSLIIFENIVNLKENVEFAKSGKYVVMQEKKIERETKMCLFAFN